MAVLHHYKYLKFCTSITKMENESKLQQFFWNHLNNKHFHNLGFFFFFLLQQSMVQIFLLYIRAFITNVSETYGTKNVITFQQFHFLPCLSYSCGFGRRNSEINNITNIVNFFSTKIYLSKVYGKLAVSKLLLCGIILL